jgi:hypothetical protein
LVIHDYYLYIVGGIDCCIKVWDVRKGVYNNNTVYVLEFLPQFFKIKEIIPLFLIAQFIEKN